MFDGHHFVNDEQVLITDAGGVIEAVIPYVDAGDDVQLFNGIIAPGFINCHCHMELSHMKGLIPEKTGLVDFVFHIVTQRHHPEEKIIEAISTAADEMLRKGIVAVGDICNNALSIPEKKKARLSYYNFIESSGWLPEVAPARFERALQLLQAYQQLGGINAIVPHAPYSVSEKLWTAIQPYFKSGTVSIHNQETRSEDEFFQHGTGDFQRMYALMNIDNSHHQPTRRSSLQSYFEKLSGAARILLVHDTFTQQQDIDFAHQHLHGQELFFCLCINANQYIENALPPLDLLQANGCNIVLGTDSLASNWSLSILDEIKTVRRHFPHIPVEELLRWATSNGARALGFAETLGSFEKGKKPGVVFLDENLSFIQRLV